MFKGMSSAGLTNHSRLTDADVMSVCRDALRVAKDGDCATAFLIVAPLWAGVGSVPDESGLGRRARAELYRCAGTITSLADQTPGAQRDARRLLARAARAFNTGGEIDDLVRCGHEIAASYLRSGLHCHARRVARRCLEHATRVEPEVEAGLVLVYALAEWSLNRPDEALAVLTPAFSLFEAISDERMAGAFHGTLASAYHSAGVARNDTNYLRSALMEFTAAAYYFEQAGSLSHISSIKNNIGYILSLLGQHDEAHPLLDQAKQLALSVGDGAQAARVDVTRAQVLSAEGRCDEAERTIRHAIGELERHGATNLLIEARSVLLEIDQRRPRVHPNVIPFGPPARHGARFVLTVSDDSLINAGIEAGDNVWLCRASHARDGELAYVSTPDCMMLAFIFGEGEEVSLVFANGECRPRRYPAKFVRVRGVVLDR